MLLKSVESHVIRPGVVPSILLITSLRLEPSATLRIMTTSAAIAKPMTVITRDCSGNGYDVIANSMATAERARKPIEIHTLTSAPPTQRAASSASRSSR